MSEQSIEKGWRKGLALIQLSRRRAVSRKAQAGGAVRLKAGRPATRTGRRMAHEALHAALAGLAKA